MRPLSLSEDPVSLPALLLRPGPRRDEKQRKHFHIHVCEWDPSHTGGLPPALGWQRPCGSQSIRGGPSRACTLEAKLPVPQLLPSRQALPNLGCLGRAKPWVSD